jgi:hypothetical protein
MVLGAERSGAGLNAVLELVDRLSCNALNILLVQGRGSTMYLYPCL